MKVLPRTITRDQDRKLRKLAEKTGRKISELAREAVKEVLWREIKRKNLQSGKNMLQY